MNAGSGNQFFATHTFTGNTFNRNGKAAYPPDNQNPIYTKNNILVVGSGQNPQQKFSDSKCRLVFSGNGFFVNQPGVLSNNYEPSPTRRAINIEYFSDQYWEFDIVEQGNAYAGKIDAPLFSGNYLGVDYSRTFQDRTPQLSEYTRVKAFGYFRYITERREYQLLNTYNIGTVIINEDQPGTMDGRSITINFANELQTIPIPVLSFQDLPNDAQWGVIGSWRILTSTSITIDIYDFITKERVLNSFCLVVF
jgi:hypothetical protein